MISPFYRTPSDENERTLHHSKYYKDEEEHEDLNGIPISQTEKYTKDATDDFFNGDDSDDC